jgi:hypothetical protein
MNFATRIRRITDKLTYNHAYALDYPEEDRTSLEREERLVRDWLADVMSMVRREDVGDWLRLGNQCVVEAFEHFRKGDQNAGCRSIDSAIEYLNNATKKKPFKVDFVARPDGTVENAPEE